MSSELDALVDAVLVPGFVGVTPPDWLRRRLSGGLGAVALFGRNVVDVSTVRTLTDALRSERADVLVALDEEGGDVTRLEASQGSRHPAAMALGHLDDVAATRAVGRSIGGLLDRAGCDWSWAPVLDVAVGGGNPAIGVRSFGSSPRLVARHGAEMVRGLQDDAGIAACAKHFPGHLDSPVDPHLGLPVVEVDCEELERLALAPFRASVAAGVRSIMTAHLVVPALDPDLPATLSRRVLQGLLREELGFDGVVVSDALEMAGAASHWGIGEAGVRALAAGVDALCLGGDRADEHVVDEVHGAVVAAVGGGRLALDRLASAAARVAALAAWRREARREVPSSVLEATAARGIVLRAIDVVGEPVLVAGDPLVVDCTSDPLIAAGRSGLSVGDALSVLRPGTTTVLLSSPPDAGELLHTAAGRPLVVVTRDARQEWQRRAEAELVAARPDAVVVDLGVPSLSPAAARARITTRGTTSWTPTAVARLLAGAHP
jgi:beta-N-acetylhexosaminidase